MITWGHLSCATVVYGLEASAQCFVQSQWDHLNLQQFLLCPSCGLLALPAWEQHKALGRGCAEESGGAALKPRVWLLLLLSGLGSFSPSVSLSSHCQSLSPVSPLVPGPRILCALPVAVGIWPLNNCCFLFISVEVFVVLLFVFQLSTHDISISLLGRMSITCENLWILLFSF